ncbi:hypothetical protein [Streptomyces sp. NPDC055299]
MRSRQLALCAAVAACAVMAAPAYGVGVHGTGTGTGSGSGSGFGTGRNLVASAPYAPRTAPYALGRAASREATGCHAVWGAACPSVFAAAVPPVRSAELLAAADEASPARPRPTADAGPRHELSSTSAVGLVLAGGAVLVIAGQLLRLRLRLRRTRRGGADER